MDIPEGWRDAVGAEADKPYFRALDEFVAAERQRATVYPPPAEVFAALTLSSFAHTKVVVLGQDPYHQPGQAHGLAFSVPAGVPNPPSLINIFKELSADLGCPRPTDGCLEGWAQQGVLLLNTVLTVRADEPNSHQKRGWEVFTDAILAALSRDRTGLVFLLWGKPAQSKRRLVDEGKHLVLAAAHPSPLAASRGFFGSRPFSATNQYLEATGSSPIQWNPAAPTGATSLF